MTEIEQMMTCMIVLAFEITILIGILGYLFSHEIFKINKKLDDLLKERGIKDE